MSSVRAHTVRSASVSEPSPVLPGEIEISQRARGVEIGVRIEAPDEHISLVAQIVLDLELGVGEREPDVVRELQPPPELVGQRHGGQIGDVADHARHAHARVRRAPGGVVVPALPVRIGDNRVARDRVPRDALRLQRRACWR